MMRTKKEKIVKLLTRIVQINSERKYKVTIIYVFIVSSGVSDAIILTITCNS